MKEKATDEKEKEVKQLQQHLNVQKECVLKKDVELRHTKMLLSSAYDQIEKLKNKVNILFVVRVSVRGLYA